VTRGVHFERRCSVHRNRSATCGRPFQLPSTLLRVTCLPVEDWVSSQWILFFVVKAQICFLMHASFSCAFVLLSSETLLSQRQNVVSFSESKVIDKNRRLSFTTAFATSGLDNDNDVLASRQTPKSVSCSTSPRECCPRCKRPNVVCICHALPDQSIDCGTSILILQHPREAKKRKRTSTVPLIGLSIQNVAICVGTFFDETSHPLLTEALARNNGNGINTKRHALLLYPSKGALPLTTYLEQSRQLNDKAIPVSSRSSFNNNSNNNNNSHNILVVLDGTWTQTQSIVKNSNQTFQKLPQVMFDDATDSIFDLLRKEPAEHCTSTLEAVSRALRLLGGSKEVIRATDSLENSLRAMVNGQLRFALNHETARPRYFRRKQDDVKLPIEGTLARRRVRKMVSRRRNAELSRFRPKTTEELELERIRFVYIAHMG